MAATASAMQIGQQSGHWALASGAVDRLTVGPGERRLEVHEGRLWITVEDRSGGPARDLWLEAGEGASFADGEQLMLEAWPSARFALLVPPSVCARRQGAGAPRADWRRWLSAVRAWPGFAAAPRVA